MTTTEEWIASLPKGKASTEVATVVVDAEIVLSAREHADKIKTLIVRIGDDAREVLAGIELAIADSHWSELGYSNHTAYVEGEFSEALEGLPHQARGEFSLGLVGMGLTGRTVGRVLGVTEGTVRNDVKKGIAKGVTHTLPDKVTAKDGRQIPRADPGKKRKPKKSGDEELGRLRKAAGLDGDDDELAEAVADRFAEIDDVAAALVAGGRSEEEVSGDARQYKEQLFGLQELVTALGDAERMAGALDIDELGTNDASWVGMALVVCARNLMHVVDQLDAAHPCAAIEVGS